MSSSGVDRAHSVADDLFDRDAATYGTDLARYRGHVHRVIGLVGVQCDIREDRAYPLGVAAYYHDAGIWLDDTWDYLPPSVRRAVAEMGPDADHHAALVTALIDEHHRIRRARSADPLVEAFRRADLVDVSRGLVAAGVPAPATVSCADAIPTPDSGECSCARSAAACARTPVIRRPCSILTTRRRWQRSAGHGTV